MTGDERLEQVHSFVAETVRRAGLEPVAVETSEDDSSTLVICENGDVYRIRTIVHISKVSE